MTQTNFQRWGGRPREPWPSLTCGSPVASPHQFETTLPARDYDLAATLDSGQVFRWRKENNSWTGIVGKNYVYLTQKPGGIFAETAAPQKNWNWLRDFLQTEIGLERILKTFPDDKPMNNAVAACRGLRILRQEPWECLASFILSSTKQIIQIRQIVSLLCERFGEPITVGTARRTVRLAPGHKRTSQRDVPTIKSAFTFPTPQR
ncbi:MAG: DNA glycosylase, partial [Limisphaerales bacterium]